MAGTDSRIVRQWLKSLGVLTAGNMDANELRTRIETMGSLLAREYPAWAFTTSSLAHVGRACRFFPTYGEACDALTAWCKEHRPANVRLLTNEQPEKPAEVREAEEIAADRKWWLDRIARLRDIPNLTARWREAFGMNEVLSRPDAYPREWAIGPLADIMAECEFAGCDQDVSRVYLPMIMRPRREVAEARRGPRTGRPVPLSGAALYASRKAIGMPAELVEAARPKTDRDAEDIPPADDDDDAPPTVSREAEGYRDFVDNLPSRRSA
jgi:hypothetical protein